MKKLIPTLILSVAVSGWAASLNAAPPSGYGQAKSGWMRDVNRYISAERYEQAVLELKRVIRKDPGNADAYSLMGYSHRKLKNYGEAEQYYAQALRIDAEHVSALEYLGELYVETNRLPEAREMLERIDEACFFHCEEYDELKAHIESAGSGMI